MDTWSRDPMSTVMDITFYANYNMQISYDTINSRNTLD